MGPREQAVVDFPKAPKFAAVAAGELTAVGWELFSGAVLELARPAAQCIDSWRDSPKLTAPLTRRPAVEEDPLYFFQPTALTSSPSLAVEHLEVKYPTREGKKMREQRATVERLDRPSAYFNNRVSNIPAEELSWSQCWTISKPPRLATCRTSVANQTETAAMATMIQTCSPNSRRKIR